MDSAYQRMLVNGVRMLLVVDEKNVIVGLITSVDVEGEAPLKLMQERALQREELRVADIVITSYSIHYTKLYEQHLDERALFLAHEAQRSHRDGVVERTVGVRQRQRVRDAVRNNFV